MAVKPPHAMPHPYPAATAAPVGASTLDELQARLQDLQRQRQMLKRPEMARRPSAPGPPRPRTASMAERGVLGLCPPGCSCSFADHCGKPYKPTRADEHGVLQLVQPVPRVNAV